MNKKTIGAGVRHERTDHAVIAATLEAKDKLREQLGHGEDVKVENLSKVERMRAKLVAASRKCDEKERATTSALQEQAEALIAYQQAGREYLAALKEQEESNA